MRMRVDFYKADAGRLCSWIATPPHRRAFQGTTMAAGRDLPHDLTQFTIERALDIATDSGACSRTEGHSQGCLAADRRARDVRSSEPTTPRW